MIEQPIVMEAELGRLIVGLKPKSVKKVFTVKDKSFYQILWILAVEGRVEKERHNNISIEVAVEYSFRGLNRLPTGGFVAVFDSKIWVCPTENGSDSGWSVEQFRLYDRFHRDLNNIMGTTPMAEVDIPDIEEVNLVCVDVTSGIEMHGKGRFWRLRR